VLGPADEGSRADRALNASVLLSTIGAGVAGIGIGVLAAGFLAVAGVPILAVGLAAHLVGMIGQRRVQSAQLYRPVLWEQLAYWGCWAAISLLVLFAANRAAAENRAS
jgi:hypothetical protein